MAGHRREDKRVEGRHRPPVGVSGDAARPVDRALDEADQRAGRKINAPLCFLWAEAGFPARTGDPLEIWRAWSHDVTGHAIAGTGHFMPEEQPEAVAAALRAHFVQT